MDVNEACFRLSFMHHASDHLLSFEPFLSSSQLNHLEQHKIRAVVISCGSW